MSDNDREKSRIAEADRGRDIGLQSAGDAAANRGQSTITGLPPQPWLLHVSGCICTVVVIAILCTVVVPKFVELFRDLGVKELPWVTQVIVDFSDFMLHKLWLLMILLFPFACAATVIGALTMREQRPRLLSIVYLWIALCLAGVLCTAAMTIAPLFSVITNLSGHDNEPKSGGTLKE